MSEFLKTQCNSYAFLNLYTHLSTNQILDTG